VTYPTTVPFDESDYLGVFSYAPAARVIAFADEIATELGHYDVLGQRIALTTLPYDTDGLGGRSEVLISEVNILTTDGIEGYGACLGRDFEHALAVAVLDAALNSEDDYLADRVILFADEQAVLLAEAV
jgi:alpha-D-ribose 1-methylphosphonate 5-triphosphate synthase subunit PhnG